MSKRANPTVVGAFVVGAISLALILVVALGGGKIWNQAHPLVLFFEGSVQGLKVGSPVVFRGVQVGSVTDVTLYVDRDDLEMKIPVYIVVQPERVTTILAGQARPERGRFPLQELVDKGLRAQLGLQSFVTGQLLIDLDFHPEKPARYSGIDLGVPELPTIPTPLQALAGALERINFSAVAGRIGDALEEIGDAVASEAMTDGLRALPAVLAEAELLVRDLRRGIAPVLSGADDTLRRTRELVVRLDSRTEAVSNSLQGTLGDTRTLVQDVGDRVDVVAARASRVLDNGAQVLHKTDQALPGLLARADGALADAEVALEQVSQALQSSPQASYELTLALRETAAAARSIRALADLLQQRPDALLRGKASGGR